MEQNRTKLDSHISAANWAGLVIILTSVILLIIVIGNLLCISPKDNTTKEIKISYKLIKSGNGAKNLMDSTSLEYLKLIEQNNKRIVEEVNQSVKTQYDRMQSIIDSKEEQNIYNNYGAGIIALILAVAGFFGFKSINEMKKDAIEKAENEAKNIAEETAKNISTRVSEEVAKNEARERYPRLKEELIGDLRFEFNQRFEEKELKVSDEFQNKIRKELNEKYNELDEKYDQLIQRMDICCPDTKNINTALPIIEAVSQKDENKISGEDLFSDQDVL